MGIYRRWLHAWRSVGGDVDRHLEFTMGLVSRQTLAQYMNGHGSLLSIAVVGGGAHDGTPGNLDISAISGSSTAFPVCTLNDEQVTARFRVNGVNLYQPNLNPYAPPELGPRGKMTNADACADAPRNVFTDFARWAIRVRTSTYHPGSNTFDADGFAACYLNEVELFSASGLTLNVDAPNGSAIFFNFGAVADMGKFWLIRSSIAPPTDSNGDLIGSPAGLVFFDDFSSGINLTRWANSGVTALANCGPLNGPGVSGLATNPAISWWNIDRMAFAQLSYQENPVIPTGQTFGTWSRAWRD